jgi:outer membrane murein-binding lipoprotein Lpp
MDSFSTLREVLSGGVAGAVISALWNHFSKRSLQRREEDFRAKLATLEHDFQRSQSQAQAQIERSIFVTRAHFETEFEAMKDIFGCLSEVQFAINAVRPMVSLEPAGESEDEKLERLSGRLKTLMAATDKMLTTSEAKAPFYTEDLYASISSCWRAAVTEINSIREDGKNALSVPGYLQSDKNRSKFSESYLNSVRIIRERISKLAILPGS